mmetsp:Transcript_43511/g.101625  ORF Transcript_43511/g.101625 Transcript_43511/m.101625 type:complete len:211 (-) Transcript_43511:140-772(-)
MRPDGFAESELDLRANVHPTQVNLPQIPCCKRQLAQGLQGLPASTLALLEVQGAQPLGQAPNLGKLSQQRQQTLVAEAHVPLKANFFDLLPFWQHAYHRQQILICQAPPWCRQLGREACVEVEGVRQCSSKIAFPQVLLGTCRWLLGYSTELRCCHPLRCVRLRGPLFGISARSCRRCRPLPIPGECSTLRARLSGGEGSKGPSASRPPG